MERSRAPIVFALLLVAFTLRLLFVCRLPAVTLYWDEPHYEGFGKLYATAWLRIGDPSAFLSALRAAFEKTIWKGEAYSATIGLVYALVGPHPRAVLVLQTLADTLGCLCVYGIALELGGSAVAVIAFGLAALYEPFIFAAARLQSETLSSCLFLGALWAIVAAARRGEIARHVLAGVLLALAMLMRQALQYMFPLLLLLVPVAHWDAAWRRKVRLAVAFSAGFFLLIGPRLVATNYIFGHPIWGGARAPSINAYAGVVLENIGWQTDHFGFAIPPRDELLGALQYRGVSIPTDEDFHRATRLTLLHHPVESAAVTLHKLYQAWAHPYNDSRWEFVSGLHAQCVWHKLLLVVAVVGLPLSLRVPRVAIPLLAVAAYLWGTYLGVGIEVRHALPALPLMVCFAAVAIVILGDGLRAQWRRRRMRRVLILVGMAIGLHAALQAIPPGRLLDLFPTLAPAVVEDLRVGVRFLVLLAGIVVTFDVIRSTRGWRWAMAAAGPAFMLGAAVLLVGRPLATVWHWWTCPLADERHVARQEFVLPADLPPPQKAELRLDLMGPATATNDLIVSVNGVEARRFVGGPGRDDAVLPPPFYMEVFNAQGLAARPWRGWYAVPLPVESIVAASKLEVEVHIAGNGSQRGAVGLVGDYPSDNEHAYDGPSPFAPQSIQDTSIYRYLNAGDWRMRRRIELQGASRSGFFDGQNWSAADLSPAPGCQLGRYRILLLLHAADGRTLAF